MTCCRRVGAGAIVAGVLLTFCTNAVAEEAAEPAEETEPRLEALWPAESSALPSDNENWLAPAGEVRATLERPRADEPEEEEGLNVYDRVGADLHLEETDEEEEAGSESIPIALPTGEERSAVTPQALSLPTGGGTIEGMGESFQALLSSGQATFSVPIALPGGRAGTGASLSLSYSTGSGNSIAGIGWSLGVAFIARQTDRGLPRYDRGSLDRFIYNGGQELVPIADSSAHEMPEGEAWPAFVTEGTSSWIYFRARIEGDFLRFFLRGDERQWIVQDTDGTLFIFGESGSATSDAIIDFEDGGRTYVYRWNISSVIDTSGNRVEYRYLRDLGQSYLSDIYWNNPPGGASDDEVGSYQHHVTLAYADRTDPFFSYSSGFRLETALRLVRIDVESVPFGGAPGSGYQHTRSYTLGYDGESELSLLSSVQLHGRNCYDDRESGCTVTDNGSLPAMTFSYTGLTRGLETAGYGRLNTEVSAVADSPPHSVSEERADFFDANADGLPDLLVTNPARYGGGHGLFIGRMDADRNVYFEQTRSDITCERSEGGTRCSDVSGDFSLSNANINPLDMDGDGHVEYLHMPHFTDYEYYRLAHDSSDPLDDYAWERVGSIDPGDPDIDFSRDADHIRLLDVNNDHLIDVVRTAGTRIQTFLNLGRCPGGDGQFGTPEYDRWGACSAFTTDPIESCALYRGLPLDFSDPELQLADMNGDGLQDIVHLRRGDVAYWPGRGPGVWGEGDRECSAGTFGDDRELVMEDGPFFGIGAESLHLADVNADGTADLVQVRFMDTDVWLNRGGYGWTERYIIEDTPAHPDFADRIRLADLNGSGSPDVVWGDASDYRFLDLTGGVEPRLLSVIENGFGKTRQIFFRSSIDYQVDEENAGRPWESTTPMPITVVAGTVVDDGLGEYSDTEYEYRDPQYDGLEAEFLGFSLALTRLVGDENSPTSVTVSRFDHGARPVDQCPACSMQELSLLPNPNESLKGAIISMETRDDVAERRDPWSSGESTYLESSHTSYTIDLLHQGLDGRNVWHRWPSQTDTLLYSNDPWEAGSASVTLPSVTRRSWLPAEAEPTEEETLSRAFVLSSDLANVAHVRETRSVNRWGRTTIERSEGIVGEDGDELASHAVWVHDQSSWIHRQCEAWVEPDPADVPAGLDIRLEHHRMTFDEHDAPCVVGERGLVTLVEAQLFSRDATGGWMTGRWLPQERDAFDEMGLVVEQWVGGGPGDFLRHGERQRDAAYDNHVVLERAQVNRPGEPDRYLEFRAAWDTGHGTLTSVTDPRSQHVYLTHDRLGRQTALYRPMCQEPAVVYEYLPNVLPGLSAIHQLENEACDRVGDPAEPEEGHEPLSDLDASTGVLESYLVFDSLGRARAMIDEGDADDGFGWVVSGVKELDAKGEIRAEYQPLGLDLGAGGGGNPLSDLSVTELPVPSRRTTYDAFGRPVQTFDEEGRRAVRQTYGARSRRSFDANRLDADSSTHGAVTTIVVDGRGRPLRHVLRGDDGHVQMVEATYDPAGNLLRMERGEAGESAGALGGAAFVAGRTVARDLFYDSLSRRTHTVDPDAGIYRYYHDRSGTLTRTVDGRGVRSCFAYDLAGRLIAEDHGCDGAGWSAEDGAGHSTDDDASLARQGELVGDLFDYIGDDDGDFVPEQGADVLYGFDRRYTDEMRSFCVASPADTQENVLGALSWVRDHSGCTWSSYDARSRLTWSARQIEPDGTVYVSRSSYQESEGDTPPDELDRVRVGEYPDGALVHFAYSDRGLLERVWGTDGAGDRFNRVFIHDIRFDEHGRRVSDWRGDPHQPGAAEVHTESTFDVMRRLRSLRSELFSPLAPDGRARRVVDNRYHYDPAGNVVRITDLRDEADAEEWSPTPVSYTYRYDSLFRLTDAEPTYASGTRYTSAGERVGDQRWTHDALGSMTTWTAVEDVAGEHFYRWGLGTVVNGQQLIEAGAPGLSPRCSLVDGAADRAPAPHALYFAYQPAEDPGDLEALEACYDAAGNMVALYRLELTGCPSSTEPLNESAADWEGGCAQSVVWELEMWWDAVGRLERVERAEGGDELELRHVYDASNDRVIRIDTDRAAGTREATLYINAAYEVRNATVELDGSYVGGERTKYVFAGIERVARVVEDTDGGVLWPNPPGRPYVFQTLTNHLGSAAVTVNAQPELGETTIVEAQAQLPYGAEDARVESLDYGGWRPDYEFAGKEEDPEVGLMNFGARFYAAGLGRFISPDPLYLHWLPERDGSGMPSWDITDALQLNLYGYALSRPVNLVDPDGLSIEDVGRGFIDGLGQTLWDIVTSPLSVINNIRRAFDALHRLATADSGGDALDALLSHPMFDTLMAARDLFNAMFGDQQPDYSQLRGFLGHFVMLVRGVTRFEAPSERGVEDYNMGYAIAETLITAGSIAVTAGLSAAARSAQVLQRLRSLGLCFIAGTLVTTPAGLVPIEEISAGDVVLARDEGTGELEWRPVLETFETPDQEVGTVEVTTEDGDEEHLGVTPGHPFWVDGRGWVPASKLAPGDVLFTPTAAWVRVSSGTWASKIETVYNLHIEGDESYFVGKSQVWVHNNSKAPTPRGGRGSRVGGSPSSSGIEGRTTTGGGGVSRGAGQGGRRSYEPPAIESESSFSRPGKMNQEIRRGQAPPEVERVDNPHVRGQEPHVHFREGSVSTVSGGESHRSRGTPRPSRQTREWLRRHGWRPPESE